MTNSTAPRPAPRKRGRPSTGAALSSTQRSTARRQRVRGDGGQVVTALLTPAAAQALHQLRARGATVDAALCAALLQAAAALAGPPVRADGTPAVTDQAPQQ